MTRQHEHPPILACAVTGALVPVTAGQPGKDGRVLCVVAP